MADEQPPGTTDDTGSTTPPGNGGAPPPNPPGNDPATPPADGAPATDATDKGEDWKARSRTWEDRAKANKKTADDAAAAAQTAQERLDAVLKAAGLKSDDTEDPAKAVEKATADRDAKDAELRALKVERAAEKLGRKAGADVDLLLDSDRFLKVIAKLDPVDDSFDDDLKDAVDKALADNPRLKAGAATPTASATTDVAGGGEQADQLTRAQLKTMTPKQIEAAREAGKLRNLLGG